MVTGSAGLVGSVLVRRLLERGDVPVPFDLRDPRRPADVLDPSAVAAAAADVNGIVHLAAVSRVAWGEARPAECEAVNVQGTHVAVEAARAARRRPWLVLASSREVYGEAASLPVSEDAPLDPVNIYGRTKRDAEAVVTAASDLPSAILRLSSVYGGSRDHPGRAVPSLLWRALQGLPLIVTGAETFFDFVHVEDTVRGLLAALDRLAAEQQPQPPVNLATGVATALGALARKAVAAAGSDSPVLEAPRRGFDVSGYQGSAERAWRHLGWRAGISLDDGLGRLVAELRRNGPPPPVAFPTRPARDEAV